MKFPALFLAALPFIAVPSVQADGKAGKHFGSAVTPASAQLGEAIEKVLK